MKRAIIAGLIILLFSQLAHAQDKPNWFHRHKRALTTLGINLAADGVLAWGLAHCRQGDVEKCLAHYGAAWGTYAAAVTGSTVLSVTLSENCYNSQDNKWLCRSLAYGPSAFMVGFGIQQYYQYTPETSTASLARLSQPYFRVRR
jgi:hypothetical protein